MVVGTVLLATSPAHAQPSALRAVGWFKGKAEISQGRINCEIPTVQNAISEGAFVVGLWNTYGAQTLEYPDPNNPFANPCGVWLQVQNNLYAQAIAVDRIELRYRIQNARTFMTNVITTRRFPYACRILRRETIYDGTVLNPWNTRDGNSGSGAPNVAFVQMLPLASPQLVTCLREVYGPRMTGANTGLSLVVRATVVGRTDAGAGVHSNQIAYTLTMRHTCGNGRVDDGEQCDPSAPPTCSGSCQGGHCTQDQALGCTTDADCDGTCLGTDVPSECTCAY